MEKTDTQIPGDRPNFCSGIIINHLAVLYWHGLSHTHAPVPTTLAQDTIIYSIIIAAPLIGLVLLYSQQRRVGYTVIAIAFFVACLFGVLNHFVLRGVDHISQVPAGDWQLSFQVSSLLLAILESAGFIAALIGIRKIKFQKL